MVLSHHVENIRALQEMYHAQEGGRSHMSFTDRLVFPLSLDTFQQIQEQLTGEPTPGSWRVIYADVLPIINDAYEAGRCAESLQTIDIETAIQSFKPEKADAIRRFMLALESWRELAYSRATRDMG